MQEYNKIIVPLGLQGKDADAISWACRTATATKATEVLFIHPYDEEDMPESLRAEKSFNEDLLVDVKALVEAHKGSADSSTFRYAVIGGNGEVPTILKAIQEQESDVIVVGKRSFGSGMPVRLARKAPCSVMSVPEGSTPEFKKIMVTTDFSKYSKEALELAIQIAKRRGIPEIDSVHVYNLGRQSHKLTIPESTQLEIAADFAKERHDEFIADTDLQGITVHTHNYNNRYTYDALQAAANQLGSNLIIVSCRGKNALTAWLLGSVAENLLTESEVPVLAAKMRGTGQNLLNVLMGD
ncbi:hypothetical protein Rhal01_02777 [Rubritalea halochordaticola]|uniref:UspA domain-containing protein n=1 Tax=Rubritalea halochordaticola TaxID=714537 RepID=A0ABP9V5F6_9BACT